MIKIYLVKIFSASLLSLIFLFPTFGSDNLNLSPDISGLTSLNSDILVLEFLKIENQKIIRISFNGNEGMHGDLILIDSKNTQVGTYNFELIKFPNYASIDVTDFSRGTYSVILKTDKGTHNSTIQIQ